MSKVLTNNLHYWVKHNENPTIQQAVELVKRFRKFSISGPAWFYRPIYHTVRALNNILSQTHRVFYTTPAFRSLVGKGGEGLFLDGGVPYVGGNLEIELGKNCRLNGKITLNGRASSKNKPVLSIGDNVGISWMTTVSVGSRVELHDNVRIGGQCYLAGYPGHPIDAKRRSMGLPDDDYQVKEIVLKKDVWVGTGCTILAGVTIGEGTIIAAGSVVTKSFPANVLVGGNPAKIIRKLSWEL